MSIKIVRAKASLSMLIIFELFAVPMFLISIHSGLKYRTDWGGAIVTGIICLFILIWWGGYSLLIDKDTLIYKTLFSTHRIKLTDITRSVRTIDLISRGVRPPNRIEIYGRVDGDDVNFDINMKVFRSDDAREIETALNASKS